jgi:hypothetical protein
VAVRTPVPNIIKYQTCSIVFRPGESKTEAEAPEDMTSASYLLNHAKQFANAHTSNESQSDNSTDSANTCNNSGNVYSGNDCIHDNSYLIELSKRRMPNAAPQIVPTSTKPPMKNGAKIAGSTPVMSKGSGTGIRPQTPEHRAAPSDATETSPTH